MKYIPLTQGKYAIVDDEDFEWLNQWKWYAQKVRNGYFYAMRNSYQRGKRHMILMHRQILGLEYGDKRKGDHRNHNTLDDRRDNMRICTSQQNRYNSKANQETSSRFKGVSWEKEDKKWGARIKKINGKNKRLGRFKLEELAALAYDIAAIHEFGKFAYLNFN